MQTGPGKIRRFYDPVQGVRATYLEATAAVQEMQIVQQTYPLATMLVGRAMIGAALLAAQMEEDEMVSIYLRGDGPIETVFAEAQYDGKVRGYTKHPQVQLPLIDRQLDVSGAIGKGHMTVVRTHPGRPVPHRGTIAIVSGQIGDEVAHYLHQSEQRRSLVGLGVKVNEFGHVVAAGGVLLELMPGAPDAAGLIIEMRASEAKSLSTAIEEGMGAEAILDQYLQDFQLKEIEHPHEVIYSCRCSKQRLVRSMEMFSKEDLDDIVAKKEVLEAKCEFCGRKYSVDWTEVKDVRDKRHKTNLH